MSDPIGYVPLQIIPTVQGIQGGIEGQLSAPLVAAGRSAGQATGNAIAGGIAQAQAAVERAAEALKTAREKEADAAGKVRVAEEKLRELRAKGNATAAQLARAEEALYTAQRNEERAARSTQRAVENLAAAHDALANATDDAEESTGRFSAAINALGDRLGPAAKQMAAAAVAAAGIGTAMDTAMEAINREASVDVLAAQLGASPELAAEYGRTAADLYKQGMGESFEDVTAAIGAVSSGFITLGFEGEASLEQVTTRALNFATVFGTEVPESIQTASQLVTNGLAVNSTQAFDMMTTAFQRVPAAMRDELPEILNEYGTNFRALGFDGQTAFALLVGAAQQGKFVLDKTGDALKEFTILGSDMSQSSQDAYKAIGLDAEEMSRKVAEGGAAAQEALQAVASGLLEIEDPAERANTSIALFGTPLEDLSIDQIPAFLSALGTAGEEMDGFAGAADAMGATVADNTASKITVLKREIQDGLLTALTGAAEWIDQNRTVAAGLAIGLGALGGALIAAKIAAAGYAVAQGVMAAATGAGTAAIAANSLATGSYAIATGVIRGATAAWAAVQWVLNAAMSANPIGIVVVALAALVAGVVLAYQKSDTFRGIVQGAWEAIQSAVAAAWGFIQPILAGFVSFITDTVVPAVMSLWQDVIAPAFEAIGAVIGYWWENFASPMFNNFKTLLGLVGDAVTWLWQNVVTPAFDGIGAVVSFWWENVVTPAFDGVKAALGLVGDAFTFFKDSVITPVFDGIKTAVNFLWESVLSPVFENMKKGVGFVGDAFKAVGDVIKTAFNGVLDLLRIPVHALGNLLTKIPSKIGTFEIPGAGAAVDLGNAMKAFRDGGTVPAGRTASGVLFGPGTGTSDSILGLDATGTPTALVSAGEGIVTENAMSRGGAALVAALNAGWVPPVELLRAMLPGYAGGGTIQVNEGDINDTQRAMWNALASAWPDAVLTSATRYADVGSGFDHHMGGKAIDIAGPDMVGMAAWIAEHYPESLELIHSNGFSHNIKNGEDVGNGMSFYGAATMADHADHVHWAMASAPAAPSGEPAAGGNGLPRSGTTGGGGTSGGGTSGTSGTSGGSGSTSRPTGDATPVWIVGSDIGGTGASATTGTGTAASTGGDSGTGGTGAASADTGADTSGGTGTGGSTTTKTHPLQGAPLTGSLFTGDAPWYQQDDPWSYLQTKATDKWETTQKDFTSYVQSNWKEMVSSGLSVLGMGATGGATEPAPTFNISGTDPMGAAAAVDRVMRRKTLALQRGGGISR